MPPSRRHQFLTWAVPRVRRSRELDSPDRERVRVEQWLDGLPPTLMFCGTRDTLMPGCRLLARRAAETGWDLDYVEAPGLIHVFPMLPFIPEARRAWRQTLEFLR